MAMSDEPSVTNEQLAEVLSELVKLRQTNDALIQKISDLTELVRKRDQRIDELEQDREELREKWTELNEERNELEEAYEELRKALNRSAAPFRRRPSAKKPPSKHKRPGRKKGHEPSSRTTPADDEIDASHEVKLPGCPCCGGEVGDIRPIVQYIEDIEARRVVHEITTYAGSCSDCGRVRSRHPLQVSEATGAAGVQVGPNALAFAVDLNKRLGLSLRKTCDVLESHLGLSLSPGGLCQANDRLADRLRGRYTGLIDELQDSDVVYVDETSWWVGEPGWWLWAFTDDDETTVYRVDRRRNREVVLETLGDAFDGVVVSDCLNIYDHLPYEQHKCYAHHLKAISNARELRPESDFLREAQMLLASALAAESVETRTADDDIVGRLQRWARRLLSGKRRDRLEEKIRNRLHKQRNHLFGFLEHPAVDATNNAAERALRPAVMARKVSCGNRTERGKRTWEITASLATTVDQRDEDFAELIRRTARIRPQRPHGPPLS